MHDAEEGSVKNLFLLKRQAFFFFGNFLLEAMKQGPDGKESYYRKRRLVQKINTG